MYKVCSISRRTHASTVQSAGAWVGAAGPLAAKGLMPTTDSRLDTMSERMLPALAGTLTAAGATAATTAAVLACVLTVAIASVAAAIVRDALVVATRADASSCGSEISDGATMLATLAGTFDVVALYAFPPVEMDPLGGAVNASLGSAFSTAEVGVADSTDDHAAACVGGVGVVVGSAPGVAPTVDGVPTSAPVVGFVTTGSGPVTEVLAPPEACTAMVTGTVDDAN